jgi:hypothetical protein
VVEVYLAKHQVLPPVQEIMVETDTIAQVEVQQGTTIVVLQIMELLMFMEKVHLEPLAYILVAEAVE